MERGLTQELLSLPVGKSCWCYLTHSLTLRRDHPDLISYSPQDSLGREPSGLLFIYSLIHHVLTHSYTLRQATCLHELFEWQKSILRWESGSVLLSQIPSNVATGGFKPHVLQPVPRVEHFCASDTCSFSSGLLVVCAYSVSESLFSFMWAEGTKVENKGLGTGCHRCIRWCKQREIKKQGSLLLGHPNFTKALETRENISLHFGTLSSDEWAEWGLQGETGGGGQVGVREMQLGWLMLSSLSSFKPAAVS